jgi:hypothetical protein
MFNISFTNIVNYAKLWGEYTVHKEFIVKKNNRKKDINGFIVQVITKSTEAYVLCGDGNIKKINDISQFTSNRVKYMNDSYIELFPIINGESMYGDNFQNGGILRYEKEGRNYYTNNNPPTFGIIQQTGENFFIPVDDIKLINLVLEKINSKNKNPDLNIFGIIWSFSNNTPANGLPYIPYNIQIINYLKSLKESNIIKHNVISEWNGLIPADNAIIKRNINITNLKNMNSCNELSDDTDEISNERQTKAITILKSIYTEA